MVSRRFYLYLAVLLGVPMYAGEPFDFQQLRERARVLSHQPFEPVRNKIPPSLQALSYVQHQAIQFRNERALWADDQLPFQLGFFIPGALQKHTITVHEVARGRVVNIPFSAKSFDFGTNRLDLTGGVDYAGFRILHPTDNFGEVGSFLGASYYRMIGRGQAFGASARGLALNTVLMEKEEFPAFREFWVRHPEKKDVALTVWALLDSPSVAGAFEFLIIPGDPTRTETRAALFPRQEVKEFGIAPLTSMFLFDENNHPALGDFRPEVHDSDGLLVQTSKDVFFWRPLESGKMMRVNAYQDENPKGFGLMQRDRNFEHYQDLAARFELRPSVWVEPLGAWGKGSVELVQVPSDLEYTDNVVAFWVPAIPPKPGEALDLAYRLHWLTNEVTPPSLGRVLATRIGKVVQDPPVASPNIRFVIDFGGKKMESLSAGEQIDAEFHYGDGIRFVSDTVTRNEINGTWRLVLEITSPTKAVDLQAVLKRRGQAITETWISTWQP